MITDPPQTKKEAGIVVNMLMAVLVLLIVPFNLFQLAWARTSFPIINRPGVAGAILHTASLIIHLFNYSFSDQ